MAESDYHPGDTVPTSGIYMVLHDKNHVEKHLEREMGGDEANITKLLPLGT